MWCTTQELTHSHFKSEYEGDTKSDRLSHKTQISCFCIKKTNNKKNRQPTHKDKNMPGIECLCYPRKRPFTTELNTSSLCMNVVHTVIKAG